MEGKAERTEFIQPQENKATNGRVRGDKARLFAPTWTGIGREAMDASWSKEILI